jgi:hypothetical protein
LPRCGTGVRYGASVSASIRSAGAASAASRSDPAFLNVTFPAKLIRYPASAHTAAMAASPEKQWKITESGGHGAYSSRIDSTSACASRSWIITGFPAARAISMCARNHDRCSSGAE